MVISIDEAGQTAASTITMTNISSMPLTVDGCVQRWEDYWANDGMLWDQGAPCLALRELLEEHGWLIPKGRCLVAGLRPRPRRPCTGVDICQGAIAAARKQLAANETKLKAKASFITEDFLNYTTTLRFTIAFEYGLFSAIHPSQRQKWAEAYARLVSPQGMLIVLLAPLIQRGSPPPYVVTYGRVRAVFEKILYAGPCRPQLQVP
ncbi:hypothetical protein DL89DRAFT_321958 [Linderina pennispora]|uniref:Methyltransferase domain-containing protein n=1 Tax=Linderina pennispora TaxID=61395 RepID=A0A1Y1WA92_9FUNG|nr:uncharacterized protein DL89DRAFT_321958 [Linderina pennispora]ORX70470.1 hypothetical protein DL89DRAFT_321958 [Linderina pennispora]